MLLSNCRLPVSAAQTCELTETVESGDDAEVTCIGSVAYRLAEELKFLKG
jgi:hypothetical protein